MRYLLQRMLMTVMVLVLAPFFIIGILLEVWRTR